MGKAEILRYHSVLKVIFGLNIFSRFNESNAAIDTCRLLEADRLIDSACFDYLRNVPEVGDAKVSEIRL